MRGGKIFIHGDVGYRAGIHMKEYQDKIPALVVGGRAGSFLGEYQAGGIIVILGLHCDAQVPVGYFCGTGMHGGKIFSVVKPCPPDLPAQVQASQATQDDLDEIRPLVHEFCTAFGEDEDHIMKSSFLCSPQYKKSLSAAIYTQLTTSSHGGDARRNLHDPDHDRGFGVHRRKRRQVYPSGLL